MQIQVQIQECFLNVLTVVHTEDMRILKQDTSNKQNSEFVDGINLQTCLCLNIYSVEMDTSLPFPGRCSTYFTNTFLKRHIQVCHCV